MPSDAEPGRSDSANQFKLIRLLELPALFAVFFYLAGTLPVQVSLGLAAGAMIVVGYRSAGKASLYSCVLYMVLIVAIAAGALRGLAAGLD